jgi:hypothetical protein
LPLLVALADVPGVTFHSVVPGALAKAAPAPEPAATLR